MEQAYAQIQIPVEPVQLVDNQPESKSDSQDNLSPDPQESSQLLSEVAQLNHLRTPPRGYISSPLSSTSPSPNTFERDLSLSDSLSRADRDSPLPNAHYDYQRRTSCGSRVLFRLPYENGAMGNGEPSKFGSMSTPPTRHSSTSSAGASSLLFPCDHSRYPLDKFRKLEGFGVYDYDLYGTKEPDDDDWLYVSDSNAPFPDKRSPSPWRAITNLGFLTILLVTVIFLFVGLPLYTTVFDRGWDSYVGA